MARCQTETVPRPTRRAGVALTALFCFVVATALYSPSQSFDFVNWDDWEYVTQNPHLGALDGDFARWCLTAFRVGNWHPLTLFSYGVDHAISGVDPGGFHRTNVWLHAANSALVVWLSWLLIREVRGRSPDALFGAAVVGLLFAVHPLHVESVAWVSERKDVLYSVFWLGSLIAWLGYAGGGAGSPKRRRAYGLALVLYALSAMAKPMAVTLPLVLLVLDAYPLRRLAPGPGLLRIAVVEKLPFYAVSIATSAVTLVAQQASGAVARADLALGDRVWVAVKALGLYLAKWIAPVGLVPLYPLEPEILPGTWPYLGSLAALLILAAAAVALRRRFPALAACLAFSGITLLPVLGLIEFGHHSAADRYTYLPMLGPSLLAGVAAAAGWRRGVMAKVAVAIAVAGVVVGLGGRTRDQLSVWRDSVSLWSHVAAAYPDSSIAHYNLGHAYAMAGNAAVAKTEWERTLEIDAAHTPALYELGVAAGRKRDFPVARRYLEAVIAADPEHSLGRINLAMVADEQADRQTAERHYREFLRTAPDSFVDYIAHAELRLDAFAAEAPAGELRGSRGP